MFHLELLVVVSRWAAAPGSAATCLADVRCYPFGKSPTSLGFFLNSPSPMGNFSEVVIIVNDKGVVLGSERGTPIV